jgi:DNA repair exonuclease SbcCD ATPase subunit
MYLKSINITNYTSFGRDVKVEFDNSKQILLIGNSNTEGCDSNGSGKTNFASAIFWCLLGVPIFDEVLADEVVRYGEDDCRVELELIDNNNLLRVVRERNTTNSLEFSINGAKVNNKTTVPSEVQKDINNYFGFKGTQKQIVSDILSTNFLSYSSVDMFVSKRFSSSERFAFISRMFDLDKWMECKQLAHSYIEALNKTLGVVEGKREIYIGLLGTDTIESLSAEIPSLEKQRDKNNELISRYSVIESTIQFLKTQINGVKSTLETLENRFRPYREDKQNQISDLTLKLEAVGDSITNCLKELGRYHKDYDNVEELGGKKEELSLNAVILNRALEEKQSRKDSPLVCPKCGSKLLQSEGGLIEFDEDKLNSEIGSLKHKIDYISNSIKVLSDKIDNIENYNRLYSKLEEDSTNKNVYEKELRELKTKFDDECVLYEEDRTKLLRELQALNTNLEEAITDNTDVIYNLMLLKENNDTIISRIEHCKTNIENYATNSKEKEILDIEIDKIKKNVAEYKHWERAFPEIRRLIIQSTLPKLEELSNAYLKEMSVPFEIKLDTLRELKSSGNLKEEFNVKVYDKSSETIFPIHLRSTGERKRVGIAVCMSLLDLKFMNSNRCLNFRFFDEVLDNLDLSGIESFLGVINKDSCQNIVISHNDFLKSRFNKVIRISKINGVSYAQTQD